MADSKKPGEAQEPKGSTNNVTDPAKENLIKDDFFKDLTDIDDGFNLDFTGISTDNSKNIQDVVSDSSIKLDPPKESKPEANKDEKIKTTVLKPAATVNKKKEIEMTNKRLESLGLNPDDPASKQFAEIWEHMNTTDASEFKLQVLRLEPAAIKGVKISGYLTTFHLPTTIPDIVEQVGQKYGGGRYQIRIVNGAGKYVKSKTFDIAGLPKIPGEEESKVEPEKETKPADTSANDDWDDDDDDDLDLRPRRPSLRPRPHMGGFGGMGGMDPDFPPFQQPTFGGRGSFGRRHDPSEDVKREFEDKLRRVEDQIDSKFDKLTNLIAMQNSQPKNSGLFSPEMFQHIAPVVGAYLESNRTRESSSVKQAAEMNQQMANLMQGMQDLVRLSDKSKEDLSEKERADREAYRREMMEQQNRMQMQMLQQQQQQEERFQKMMLAMKESFESQRSNENSLEAKLRMDFESQREAARERELKLMMEAREREAQLREEARRREDESRQRDFNMREQIRLEQIKFQEEMRRRDEEARQREIDRLEQMRIKEIQAVTEQKTRELEVQERIRAMDSQKVEMQHKLLEQFYTNNIGQRDSQLQLEMAIAKLSSDNEQKHLTQLSQMELEKMKHQTQMQMLKMKHDLSTLESNKQVEDPMDTALKDYLKRRMQIDMIKELGADYDDEDIPGNSISSILKNLVKEGAGAVAPVLNQILAGGMAPSMPAPRPQVGRVVNPSPAPTPTQPKQPTDVGAETNEDGVEAYVTDESEHVEDMDVDAEGAEGEVYEEEQDYVDESYAFDPMQEIPRVAEFFEYLKVSIDNNSATPQEAAIVLQQSLAPPLVEYITGITDSYAIIEELYPLLTGYNPDFGPYFTQQHVLDWMTLMLRALNGEDVNPTPEPEAKAEPEPTPEPEAKAEPEPTPEPTPEPEVKAEPEPKAEAEKPKPKTKKKTTKKTTKKSRTRKTSTKKEEVSKS